MGYSEHTARGAGHLDPAREQPQGHEGMGSAERGTGGSPTHALGSTGRVGRPMHAAFEPIAIEAPPRSNRGLTIGIGVGVLLIGFGVIRSMTSENKPSAREPSVVGGYLSEQQRLMRDAIDTARAAQELQREHMRRMREEMMSAEFGYAEMGGGD